MKKSMRDFVLTQSPKRIWYYPLCCYFIHVVCILAIVGNRLHLLYTWQFLLRKGSPRCQKHQNRTGGENKGLTENCCSSFIHQGDTGHKANTSLGAIFCPSFHCRMLMEVNCYLVIVTQKCLIVA